MSLTVAIEKLRVMGFLASILNDPLYQRADPRKPEDINDDSVIISPDTHRENRLPPGQTRTRKFPVLDAHGTPKIDVANWRLTIGGLVKNESSFTLDEFMSLPPIKVFADFHCVTRWSRLDNIWSGVSTREIAERAGVKAEARFVVVEGHDYGWTTNLPIEYFLQQDALFAWAHEGQPIAANHGGPVRLVVPQLYAWKSAKWVKSIKFVAEDAPGFWEQGGYHLRGVPWNGKDGERFG